MRPLSSLVTASFAFAPSSIHATGATWRPTAATWPRSSCARCEQVNDSARAPRSLTVHFLKGPEPGPAEVELELLRQGGKISCLSARLVQAGVTQTFAVGAFGSAFDGQGFQHAPMPAVPEPGACPELARSRVAIDHRFEHRLGLGALPFAGHSEALMGGWSRLEAARAFDALSVAILCDAWWPAVFSRLNDKSEASGCPTVDLTIHFRTSFPVPGLEATDYVLVELRTEALNEGYLDERCRMWTKGGVLLAQTVQHAASLRPRPPEAGLNSTKGSSV
jgi:acyl-CoA thioesterase